MYNKIMKKALIFFCFSILFISCSKKSSKQELYRDFESDEMAFSDSFADSFVQTSSKAVNSSWTGNGYNEEEVEQKPLSDSNQIERKLIKQGYIQLSVDSLEASDSNIESWTKKYNGYISESNSNSYNNSCNYTIKIPAEYFDEAMNTLSSFGKVRNRSITVEDVTDRFYDLESRLESKKILKDKYNQYLKKAENMKDLLEVERQLNSVISELEAMEGQMKRLNHQISYSTIELNVTAKVPEQKIEYFIKKIQWKEIFSNIINFFITLFVVIIYVIIFGLPLIILFAFLFWLLFGKIGLLRKLFIKLKGKKNE